MERVINLASIILVYICLVEAGGNYAVIHRDDRAVYRDDECLIGGPVSGHHAQGPPRVPEGLVNSVEAARGLLRLSHPKGVEVPQAAQHRECLHRGAPHRRRGRRGGQQQGQPTQALLPAAAAGPGRWRRRRGRAEVAQVAGARSADGPVRVRSSPSQPAASSRQ